MGTTADKLARIEETKALLKQRLVEKGITEAASDDNFYKLADAVAMIFQMKSITVTGDGTNKIVVPFSINRFFICASKVLTGVISGLYSNSDINIVFANGGLGAMAGTFTVTVSESKTTISSDNLFSNFADGAEYIIYYW